MRKCVFTRASTSDDLKGLAMKSAAPISSAETSNPASV